MNKKVAKSNLSLLMAAAIWGLAFVAQSDSTNYIGAFAFTSIRYFLGALALIPICIVTLRSYKKQNGTEALKKCIKRSVILGLMCGIALFSASSSQQIGLKYTSAGKAGFITALYIVLVPVFAGLIFKSKTSVNTWIGVAAASVGLYFLCVNEGLSVEKGDVWEIACAFLFTVQILLIDRYSNDTDSVLVSIVQFSVSAALAILFMFIFEPTVTMQQISDAKLSILYTGLFSSAAGYTLQIVGQKGADNPTVASLLMSLESLFAALFGWLILHETLSGKEFIGIALMACAIVISQLPSKIGKKA